MISRYLSEPDLVELTNMERLFAGALFGEDSGRNKHDTSDIDFIARTTPGALLPFFTWYTSLNDKESPELDIGEFEINYRFTEAIRDNTFTTVREAPTKRLNDVWGAAVKSGQYGASGFSFRMLYEFLCRVFNRGELFVDTYFNEVFTSRPVYSSFKKLREDILADMARDLYEAQLKMLGSNARFRKGGRFISASQVDDSILSETFFKAFEGWEDFSVWKDAHFEAQLSEVGQNIRTDIIYCLENGIIPLQHKTKHGTMARREALGLNSEATFYASGQLINNLEIYINLDREAA